MNKQLSWRILGMSVVLSLLLFGVLDGWAQLPLLTHWTQDYPYNQLCPRDPVNGYSYSYAGCPAIAMGQIINYLRTTEGTRFDDGDDSIWLLKIQQGRLVTTSLSMAIAKRMASSTLILAMAGL